VPTSDPSLHAPWLAAQRRSRARRAAAARRLRRVRGLRSALLVAVASLALAATAPAATSGAAPKPSPTVAAVQRALGVDADGLVGPQTRRAIRRFQRRHGLAADGVIGPATLAALGLGAAHTATAGNAAALEAIADCESGGDPTAVSADGQYRGKYQFSFATWAALGGSGDPAAAPEAEQDARAATLYAARGTAPWPNCA
jgi:peptidoglycan hydrolase-like protein with peptidoglycan-binding domain